MTLLHEPAGRLTSDMGTPAVAGEPTVDVEIDGVSVTVPEGTSIMRAAAEAGIDVPKLCATETLKSFGSCRVCLVEIEGRPGTPASCTTPVAPGMRVATTTPRVDKLRQGVVELYLSDHPEGTCVEGACELHAMADTVGLQEVRYGHDGHTHFDQPIDSSNPYFNFDPKACIVCSRCVRACDEIQGTLALTVEGRGFESSISASGTTFMESECVSCGACVQACPTTALQEKSIIELGMPTRTVKTTCAYCGVGCSFDAEMKGDQLVRMTPSKEGGANEGHSCVKGRFAWGYATHNERVTVPMVRESITDAWREASWDEAIAFAVDKFKEVQQKYGVDSIGGITSSRCTNEEVFVVQKMVRAAFRNNNVDTCARVCHSPTGYGLKQTFGTSAGTQDFRSVEHADVIMVIGANPTDGHPVFASRMKQRLRAGAKLIVADPRRIDLVRSPHIEAQHHLQLMPGTNVAVINAIAHVVVTEGLVDREFVNARCEDDSFAAWEEFIARPENSPEAMEPIIGVAASELRAAARLYAAGPNSAIYYGLGVTEHSQGSTMVMGMANLAMATGNIGRDGVGVNPLRGQNNVQGSCDIDRSRTSSAAIATFRTTRFASCSRRRGDARCAPTQVCVSRTCSTPRSQESFAACLCKARMLRSPTPRRTRHGRAVRLGRARGARPLPQRDREVRARVPARHVLSREGRYLHQRRAPHQQSTSRDGADAWQAGVAGRLRDRARYGLPDALRQRRADHGRDRGCHAHLCRCLVRPPRRGRQRAVAVQRRGTTRDADHACRRLRAR